MVETHPATQTVSFHPYAPSSLQLLPTSSNFILTHSLTHLFLFVVVCCWECRSFTLLLSLCCCPGDAVSHCLTLTLTSTSSQPPVNSIHNSHLNPHPLLICSRWRLQSPRMPRPASPPPASSPTCPSTGPSSAPSSPSSTARRTCPTARPWANRTLTAPPASARRPARPTPTCGVVRLPSGMHL